MLIFLYKFESFRILDSLIAITSKALLVTLSKYSGTSKFLFKEQEFTCGIKEVNLVQFSSYRFHQYQDFYSFFFFF